jgi:hypothetical protein
MADATMTVATPPNAADLRGQPTDSQRSDQLPNVHRRLPHAKEVPPTVDRREIHGVRLDRIAANDLSDGESDDDYDAHQ